MAQVTRFTGPGSGTRRVKEVTRQFDAKMILRFATGMQSEKEVDEFVVHPNKVKSLKVGECIRIGRFPSSTAAIVAVSK